MPCAGARELRLESAVAGQPRSAAARAARRSRRAHVLRSDPIGESHAQGRGACEPREQFRLDGRDDQLLLVAVPVRLVEGLELASAALVLAALVPRDALGVDSDREGLGNERRLAALRRDPADDRVVLGQMQSNVRCAEGRKHVLLASAPVCWSRADERARRAGVVSGTRWRIDTGKRRVDRQTRIEHGHQAVRATSSTRTGAGVPDRYAGVTSARSPRTA